MRKLLTMLVAFAVAGVSASANSNTIESTNFNQKVLELGSAELKVDDSKINSTQAAENWTEVFVFNGNKDTLSWWSTFNLDYNDIGNPIAYDPESGGLFALLHTTANDANNYWSQLGVAYSFNEGQSWDTVRIANDQDLKALTKTNHAN